ncbi:MAG: hypothetical protein U0931_04620 [Vulcanimicrobiota bacterium]
MSQLQDWFQDNPRARPILMTALLFLTCLVVGIWSTAGRRPRPVQTINRTPDPVGTPDVPTLTGETPDLRQARSAWVSEKETAIYPEPGLNQPVLKKLNRWEEVFHLEQQENWDKVRLADGSMGWVQSKYLQFVKPADLDKPNDAEVTVMAFYAAVVRKDYAAAYSYLAGPWKAQLSFADFVEGYARTTSLSTEIRQVIPMGDGRFQVDVAMRALEGMQQVPYTGSYLVEKIGDEWCLSAGSLTITGGPRADPRLPQVRVPVVETPTSGTPEMPAPEEDPNPEPVPEESH